VGGVAASIDCIVSADAEVLQRMKRRDFTSEEKFAVQPIS
jgi:hypothetical protein